MDTFVDSAWYYMRYCDPQLEGAMVGAGTKYWMPMDQYIGGIEHAILHLLYARFWTKVMRDMKLVDIDEPFTKLLTQGMVLNHVWARPTAQGGVDYFPPDDVTPVGEAEGRPSSGRLADGSAVEYRGMLKMGKTERNGVDPQDLIDRYGADTARLFVMFASPPEQSLDWNNAGVEGANRFLKRLWKFAARHADTIDSAPGRRPARGSAPALRHEIHSVLRQVSYDYERMQYNTVVSGAMKLLNALESHAGQGPVAAAPLREGFGILLRVLYPVCPHTTWTLWNELGFAADHGPLLDAPWPLVDESALAQDEIELMLQVNGKLRGSIRVPAKADRAHIEAAALATPEFAKYGEGRAVRKVVVVPGRLVNVVV
jgi:leucyl-tRNA synthetase